jgi:hypothetical protein
MEILETLERKKGETYTLQEFLDKLDEEQKDEEDDELSKRDERGF